MTGSVAHEGLLTKEGYDFWKNYVNAHGGLQVGAQTYHVEIHYADDASDPALTATQLENLIVQDHIDFILGPYGSAEYAAAFTAAFGHAPDYHHLDVVTFYGLLKFDARGGKTHISRWSSIRSSMGVCRPSIPTV